MEDLILRIEKVSKQYKLGQIGGTTLQEEIHRFVAKKLHREDPTKKIGEKDYAKGETFLALDSISFDVKKGERVGIIGHNGAGKSTLLKLISKVTAPTSGFIGLNGRVASMLEVGTGFHPELTGRENIYMNGAILGMSKKEIDAKIEDIIDFSEVRQFIDTPVKRYSSGMYVKLAFAVAAHLDSEIMIMDEVLAVGDMAFQMKCLDKMSEVSKDEGRTILYVSHNMNTIRQLCDRVVVLERGKVIFEGGVEKGIGVYMGRAIKNNKYYSFIDLERDNTVTNDIKVLSLTLLNKDNIIPFGSSLKFCLEYDCNKDLKNLVFRFNFLTLDGVAVATSHANISSCIKGKMIKKVISIDTSHLAPAQYVMKIIAFEPTSLNSQIRHDRINEALYFELFNEDKLYNFNWDTKFWGHYVIDDAVVSNI